jgi:hypothetical protein
MTLRIAFLPLDGRPITRDAFLRLAAAAGVEVVTPRRAMLGDRRDPADVEALWAWVDGPGAEADLLIASAELLIYGGLVPSRIGREPLDRCLALAGRFAAARRRVPGRRLLLSASNLRLPSTADASEEPEYWGVYGPEIFAWSFHSDRFAATGDAASRARARAAEEAVPRPVLADVLSRRARNLTVLLSLVAAAARGEVDGLLIGQDDAAEYGLTRRDLRAIEAAIAEQGAGARAWVTYGTDELASRLLARAWVEAGGGPRTVEVVYAYPENRDAVPRYEGQSLDRTLSSHIATAGCRRAAGAGGLTVFVHNFPEAQQEAPHQEPYDPAVLRPFLAGVAAAASAGRPFAVADVRYSNGADRTFVEALLEVPGVASMAAYGGWNTASNTIGMALAQALLPAGAASQAFTIARFLEDWAYQADIRQRLASEVVPRVPGATPQRLGPARDACAEATCGWMASEHCPRLARCFGRMPVVRRAAFPWDRLFEVDLDVAVA